MNIKQIKKIMVKEKQEELLRYKITEEYLMSVITDEKKERRPELIEVQTIIVELESQINFLKI